MVAITPYVGKYASKSLKPQETLCILTISNIETLGQPCRKEKDDDQISWRSHDEESRLGTFIAAIVAGDRHHSMTL